MITSHAVQPAVAVDAAESRKANNAQRQYSAPRNSVQPKDIARAAEHRWSDILASLGVDPATLRNHHGPCPGCGGRDRFRFDDRDGRGTWLCGGGGNPTSGDGFDLLGHVHGWNAGEAFQAVARFLGIDVKGEAPEPRQRPIPAPAAVKPTRDLTPFALDLWPKVDRNDSVVADHPYAVAKGVTWACGAGRAIVGGTWSRIGTDADCVVVPIRTPEGELCAVECLSDRRDAAGKFLRQSFGFKSRGWLTLGNDLDPHIARYCVEGWATAARLLDVKRNCMVAVAFGAGRLMPVATEIEKRRPGSVVIVCAEAANA